MDENLNVNMMNVQELYTHYNVVREEKKQLRRSIKEFEHNFEEVNGRKMFKSDRCSIEDTYASYKQKKAKLRLLDALVRKQMANCSPWNVEIVKWKLLLIFHFLLQRMKDFSKILVLW